jgi:hypothetical protein
VSEHMNAEPFRSRSGCGAFGLRQYQCVKQAGVHEQSISVADLTVRTDDPMERNFGERTTGDHCIDRFRRPVSLHTLMHSDKSEQEAGDCTGRRGDAENQREPLQDSEWGLLYIDGPLH